MTTSSTAALLDRKRQTAAQAASLVGRGASVFIGSGAAQPAALVTALAEAPGIIDVEILHILTLGIAPYADPRFPAGRFRHNALFIGANVRESVAAGRADYTPVFLSEIPGLFRSGRLPVDVALVQATPPDSSGHMSLGVSVDVVRAAVDSARVVVVEVNPRMPRTHGDSFLHLSDVDAVVEVDAPLPELPVAEPDDVCREIARHVATLIPDEATLQLGIGEIPHALLPLLQHRHELGIHTEMLSDGVLDLLEAGVVTNRKKPLHTGKTVTAFCMGTRRLYDWLDDNPAVELFGADHVNDPFVIARHPRMIAINSAIEVDLTGQVCADSIGSRFFSGIGGQVDFIRGAARSPGGRPIIALRSTARDGAISRIVPVLSEGAGIVTTRGDVHYVVTEYGVANLYGRTVRERALALTTIAHPDFRGELIAAARARHYVSPSQIPLPESGGVYPAETVVRETLADGTQLLIRPLRPDDERELRELFYSHSPETLHRRYGTMLKRLPPAQFQHLVTVDYDARMALGAFAATGAAETDADFSDLVGVGRYDLDPATNLAECAFVVHDKWQGRGIGGRLLEQLGRYARVKRIEGFTALVLAGNSPMMRVFATHCSPLHSTLADGTYFLEMRFAEIDRAKRRETRSRATSPSP